MPGSRVLEGYTVSVLGAGRIGQAILRSLAPCGARLIGTGRRNATLRAIAETGAEPLRDNRLAVERADIIIVSVKPYQFAELASEISGLVGGKTVISVVAGVKLETLKAAFPGARVVRAMPNINALIGKSTTAIATDPQGERDGALRLAEKVFSCLGTVYTIPEEWFDTWTALVGSSPAFLAEIIDGLVLGAVMTGMPRELAYKALLDAIKATAEHLQLTPYHPLQLRDEVTTPAGTTIYGLKILESRGVKSGLMEVVETSTERGRILGEMIDHKVRKQIGNPQNPA